jgi:hypothetical protein
MRSMVEGAAAYSVVVAAPSTALRRSPSPVLAHRGGFPDH